MLSLMIRLTSYNSSNEFLRSDCCLFVFSVYAIQFDQDYSIRKKNSVSLSNDRSQPTIKE